MTTKKRKFTKNQMQEKQITKFQEQYELGYEDGWEQSLQGQELIFATTFFGNLFFKLAKEFLVRKQFGWKKYFMLKVSKVKTRMEI